MEYFPEMHQNPSTNEFHIILSKDDPLNQIRTDTPKNMIIKLVHTGLWKRLLKTHNAVLFDSRNRFDMLMRIRNCIRQASLEPISKSNIQKLMDISQLDFSESLNTLLSVSSKEMAKWKTPSNEMLSELLNSIDSYFTNEFIRKRGLLDADDIATLKSEKERNKIGREIYKIELAVEFFIDEDSAE